MAYIKVNDLRLSYHVLVESGSIRKAMINNLLGGFVRKKKDNENIVTIDAIRGVDLELDDGDRLAIIGHNGAGKTSLLKVLASIYQPTSGSVRISGLVESLINVGFGLEMEETGRENIRFILTLLGRPIDSIEQEIEEIAEFTELDEFLDLPVRTYSTGMQTRLSFAISTNIKPEILLMDEVIGAGDHRFQEKAQKRIEQIANQTKIIVLASHAEALLKEWCNKAIWMEQGKIIDTGSPEELWASYIKSMTS